MTQTTETEDNSVEHRWGRRQPTNLLVRFLSIPGGTAFGRVLNISATGAYMQTTLNLRPLSLVYLEVVATSVSDSQSRPFVASVVRRDAGGVGLEWCEFTSDTLHLDSRLAALAAVSNSAVVHAPGRE